MRLRSLTYEKLTPDARRLWQGVTNGRRGPASKMIGADGGLRGPFNALLLSPVIGQRYAQLGEAVRFDGSLDDQLRELATITAGAFWRANFEWAIHASLARAAGVPQSVVAAIANGDQPVFTDQREAATYAFARSLLESGAAPDLIYNSAVEALGEVGVVELTVTVGYYTLISFTLNAFQVPPPEGTQPQWP